MLYILFYRICKHVHRRLGSVVLPMRLRPAPQPHVRQLHATVLLGAVLGAVRGGATVRQVRATPGDERYFVWYFFYYAFFSRLFFTMFFLYYVFLYYIFFYYAFLFRFTKYHDFDNRLMYVGIIGA